MTFLVLGHIRFDAAARTGSSRDIVVQRLGSETELRTKIAPGHTETCVGQREKPLRQEENLRYEMTMGKHLHVQARKTWHVQAKVIRACTRTQNSWATPLPVY